MYRIDAMAGLPRVPILLNWMAVVSVCAGQIPPRSEYIPLKDIERSKGHGIHENHGGDAKQDAFELRDWKYPTIEGQSKRTMSSVSELRNRV